MQKQLPAGAVVGLIVAVLAIVGVIGFTTFRTPPAQEMSPLGEPDPAAAMVAPEHGGATPQ